MIDGYNFEHHFLNRHGTRYHYLDEGQGEPVVMVHGNPSWSFYYRHLVQRLSGNFRCIVPDHLGCGFSGQPDEKDYAYTLDNRVADLEALLDHLNIKRSINLVLHDWGGMIGSAFAAQFPERIKRIVYCNTAAFSTPKKVALSIGF